MIRFKIEIGGRGSERGFEGERVRIGSRTDNDLVLDDASVAGAHCVVERQGEVWRLRAIEGETLLNGASIGVQPVYDGDRIDLGAVTLTLVNEAEALRPAEPVVVAEGAPAPVMPDAVALEPPEPGTEAAEPIPVAPPPDVTATKTCPYCGRDIPEAATACRFCQESLDQRPRRRSRAKSGSWSLLSAGASASRGVSLRQMIEWVRDGTINENSSVSGPTTGYLWRYASETPGLSKHLGVCHRCGAPVSPTDGICAACRADLDGSSDQDLRRTEVIRRRTGHFLRITAALSFIVAVAAGLAYLLAFTPVGLRVLSEADQKRVHEVVDGLLLRAHQERAAADQYADERARLREAEALCRRGRFDAARQICTDLKERFAATDLAPEIDRMLGYVNDCRAAADELTAGDNLMANRRYAEALTRYYVVADKYGGTPAAEGIDAKIAAVRAAARGAAPP